MGKSDLQSLLPLPRAVLDGMPDETVWKVVYDAVVVKNTPLRYNAGSITNSTEHRVDVIPKEELEELYIGVSGFFDACFGGVPGLEAIAQAVFRKCEEGSEPLYREDAGWKDWPQKATELDVLN
ncbi:hypothetical protein GGS23DRAFT_67244 [Durotheca rogersii]|uniref:uncharacterized protein n=1 Tax=Durotheca rogersii TaxID=419775 RepID=UPI002220F6C7|nr:uncharacterized protein GGS23DRAFT_67244 [Durotheca rogersii]KAI5862790.1 hypothetical protein GGS23DRAFT_67244 [Durotheca rogersii]